MPDTTSARKFPYSLGTDKGYTIDNTMQLLAERVDAEYSEGVAASRPASSATKVGRLYRATDTGDLWRDTGSAWVIDNTTAVTQASPSGWTSDYLNWASVTTVTASASCSIGAVASPVTAASGRLNVVAAGLHRLTLLVVSSGIGSVTISYHTGSGGGETEDVINVAGVSAAAEQVVTLYRLNAGAGFAVKRSGGTIDVTAAFLERVSL